ncbi:ABC transporter [Pandoraea captiosa]|uniref:ABC transporter n=1 Tax=Pandoraea captiosa TaxID=2508302 RepID=A0A5E5ALQ8_9BURK|nr:ABC transporter ATP-binding protein [Pandoraea captiosa]VVE73505.1 ABC transporter [Pandoraea captiosa]
MIELTDVTKRYATRLGRVTVLNKVNLRIARGERVGILGGNGAGKSTLIRLISGAELPSDGIVRRSMNVSWPLAFGGAFQGSLTGLDNVRFVCRVYGAEYEKVRPFVEDFSELGKYLREPVKKYSSGMRARLAFAISMAIEFDCFLIDEVIAVGDSRFQEKCNRELFERRKDRAMLVVSHHADLIRDVCTTGFVLDKGTLHHFDDIDAAYRFYELKQQQGKHEH